MPERPDQQFENPEEAASFIPAGNPSESFHGATQTLSESFLRRLQQIRLLVLDVDGTLTDGGLYIGSSGEEFKRFDVQDGHGIVHLQKALGVEVMFLSGRDCAPVNRRAEELGVVTCIQGQHRKDEVLLREMEFRGVQPMEVAAMGDDIGDLAMMKVAGLSLAPANAVREVLAVADYITRRRGGDGAVREVADLIARSRIGKTP